MKQNSGSTLVTVIVLVTILGIGASLFLTLQTSTIKSFKNRRTHLQTIAAVRSSVIEKLSKLSLVDSAEQVNPQDLFADDSTDELTAQIGLTPFTAMITSEKISPLNRVRVRAEVGSGYTPGDTTAILFSEGEIASTGVSGQKVTNGTAVTNFPLTFRPSGITKAKKWVERQFSQVIPTSENPAIIRSQDAFDNLPDTVKGSIFFDGNGAMVTIDGTGRKIVAYGDLQFTGNVTLKNVTAIIAGEVRVNDKAQLSRCDLYIAKKLFLADNATFEGRATAGETVEIFGNAQVKNRSLLVSWAGKKNDSTSTGQKEDPAIAVRENATVDGSLVTIGGQGILTEPATKTTGILWSKTWIRHEGTHRGTVAANRFVGMQPADPSAGKGTLNEIVGRVDPLFTRKEFLLPWFIGTPGLQKWQESGKE